MTPQRNSSLSEIVEISHSSFNVKQSNNMSRQQINRKEHANDRYDHPSKMRDPDYEDTEDIINHELKSEEDFVSQRNHILKLRLMILCSKTKITLRTAFA